MANLDGGQLLAEVEKMWPKLGILLRTRIIPAINQTASSAGVSAVGNIATPNPPNGITVKTVGEYVHVSIADNNRIQRGVHYFTEADTSPAFSQPIVIHHGPSRTGAPFVLPTNDDGGSPHTWYLRSYAQYPGGTASKAVAFGGNSNPLAVSLTGSTNMTLLPSTGSGTASGNGQTGGAGFGVVALRTVPQPKRNVSSAT
jgi:hypothetical protein